MDMLPAEISPEMRAELAVLTGILEQNERIDELQLTVDDFQSTLGSRTFELMQRLWGQGIPLSPLSLCEADPNRTPFYLTFSDQVLSERHAWGFHAEQMRERAVKRRLVHAAERIKHLSTEPEIKAVELLEAARKVVDDAGGHQLAADSARSSDVATEVLANVGNVVTSWPAPWHELSSALRGFKPGQLVVLAARPSVGKSALALQMATYMERIGTVGFISMEMGKDEIIKRMISQVTLTAYTMLDGNEPMPAYAQQRTNEWLTDYQNRARIMIDDRAVVTIADIRAQIRSWVRAHHDLKMVVVDYLQLMTAAPGVPRQEAVAGFSRELKILAKEFGIVIVALSQLNRNPEQRADKRPALSDLRESGAIEQDADVVILIHREANQDPKMGVEIELIIAKSRQGPTLSVFLDWHGEFMMAIDQ